MSKNDPFVTFFSFLIVKRQKFADLFKNCFIEEMSGKDYVSMLRGREVGALGDVSPKGSEPKETWGDKGREGTPKN